MSDDDEQHDRLVIDDDRLESFENSPEKFLVEKDAFISGIFYI